MRLGITVKLTLSLIVAATLGVAAQGASRLQATNTATYLGSYTWRLSEDWFC